MQRLDLRKCKTEGFEKSEKQGWCDYEFSKDHPTAGISDMILWQGLGKESDMADMFFI